MANAGPDTNKSPFFITYRSCKHLDSKHTVFGKVVGGLETLNAMEKIDVDPKDKPVQASCVCFAVQSFTGVLQDIKILDIQVFSDPFKEADEQEKKAKDKQEAVVAKAAEGALLEAKPLPVMEICQ